MIHHADIRCDNNEFRLSGSLNFSNVMSIYNKSLSAVANCHELIFDFSAVISSDSSGIALIVEWIRLAKMTNKKITFRHVSKDLMSIAKASSLDKLFS
jgi:phospholipid transport system transporter-binding protein